MMQKKERMQEKNLIILKLIKVSPLKGKLLIQMFEKSSLRTRLSFYLAIKQLGGSTLTLRPNELHLSKEERVLLILLKYYQLMEMDLCLENR